MGAEAFRRTFESADIDGLLADLAPGFVMHHAGEADSSSDPGFIRMMWPAIREVMGDQFRFHDLVWSTFRGERYALLPWTAVIDGIEAEGVDLIKDAPDGRMAEFRVAVRPPEAVAAINRLMTARFGDFAATHDGRPKP